jgi:hypothetical protein
MDSLRQKVLEQEKVIEQCQQQLHNFYQSQFFAELPPNAELPETTSIVLDSVARRQTGSDQKLKEGDPWADFLIGELKGRVANSDTLMGSGLKNALSTYIRSTEQRLADVTRELDETKRSTKNLESHATESISRMHQSLLAIVQDNREFADSSFDSFVNHSVELLSIIKDPSEDAKMIHHFLSSFIGQLLYALNLPVLKFKDLSFDQMKDVMV